MITKKTTVDYKLDRKEVESAVITYMKNTYDVTMSAVEIDYPYTDIQPLEGETIMRLKVEQTEIV